jgi:hypothetical protein
MHHYFIITEQSIIIILTDQVLLPINIFFLYSIHEITYVFTMVYASTCNIEIRVNFLLHATVYDLGDCAKAQTNGSL